MNAPFNQTRAVHGCSAFDDKSMWACELEIFSVSGGTLGGSSVLACVDLAMKQLASAHWVRFKLDFISFYYKSSIMASVGCVYKEGGACSNKFCI